jgi:hypothetical protein
MTSYNPFDWLSIEADVPSSHAIQLSAKYTQD